MQRHDLRARALGKYIPFFQRARDRRLGQDGYLFHGSLGRGHVQDFQGPVRFGRHDVDGDVRQDFQRFIV